MHASRVRRAPDGGGEVVAGGVVSQVKPMSSDMSFKQHEKKRKKREKKETTLLRSFC